MSEEIKDLPTIQKTLIDLLKEHDYCLKAVTDTPDKFEVSGTIATMQGKKKVDGIYFATVLPKPKDIRFYFFPVYTHTALLEHLSTPLKKALKGKSCFHIKKLDKDQIDALRNLIGESVKAYQKDNWLVKK